MKISVRPIDKEPWQKTAALIILIMLSSIFSAYFMGSSYWGLFALAVLVIATKNYFIRIEFELLDDKIIIDRGLLKKERKWSEFYRVVSDKQGVFLSCFKKASKLDAFRGEYILCYEKKSEVAEFARARIEQRETKVNP